MPMPSLGVRSHMLRMRGVKPVMAPPAARVPMAPLLPLAAVFFRRLGGVLEVREGWRMKSVRACC